MTPIDWQEYANNRLRKFEILKRLKGRETNFYETLCRKEMSRERDMLASLEAKATPARVLELEKYLDGHYSDNVAMNAYAIQHMGMILWLYMVQFSIRQRF